MSCIAGVGGDVPSLVRIATSGRPIIAIDGCKLRCVQSSLARHGIEPTIQYDLTFYGVKKRFHEDFDQGQASELLEQIAGDLAKAAGAPAGGLVAGRSRLPEDLADRNSPRGE